MPFSRLAVIAFAATLSIGALAVAQEPPAIVVDPAIAGMTNEQLVEARQNAMRDNGRALRSAAELSGPDAVAAATLLLQNFTNLPALFREGSIIDKSGAKPSIWENWDDFKGRFDHDAEAARTMLAAAETGDNAAYVAAVREIGSSCNGCHELYRGR